MPKVAYYVVKITLVLKVTVFCVPQDYGGVFRQRWLFSPETEMSTTSYSQSWLAGQPARDTFFF